MSLNTINALASANIKNNLTSNDDYENYWQYSPTIPLGTSPSDALTYLDNYMSNTTLKRACCLEAIGSDNDHYSIPVRIPLPPICNGTNNDQPCLDEDKDLTSIEKKYSFLDVKIDIPSNMCNNVESSDGIARPYHRAKLPQNGDDTWGNCDDFFTTYCANTLAFYTDEYGVLYSGSSSPNAKEYIDYKPECACLGIGTDAFIGYDISARCLQSAGCDTSSAGNGKVYMDRKSRENCPDNIVICNSILNMTDSDVDTSSIDATLINNCANQPPSDGNIGGLSTNELIIVIVVSMIIVLFIFCIGLIVIYRRRQKRG